MTSRFRAKAGFTLLELLAVISVSAVMMLMATIWVGEAIKFSTRIKTKQRHHTRINQLARNLRSDVRQSQSMTIQDSNRLVLTAENGEQVVYTINGTKIISERIADSNQRRESYKLAKNSTVRWETDQMPETIGLVVQRVVDYRARNRPAESNGAIPRETGPASGTDSADQPSLPIDIHIFASVNRWPVKYDRKKSASGGDQ